jgi:hypothetical protein
MVYFQLLSRHLPRVTKRNHENLDQVSQSPGRDLKIGHLKYEGGMLLQNPDVSKATTLPIVTYVYDT